MCLVSQLAFDMPFQFLYLDSRCGWSNRLRQDEERISGFSPRVSFRTWHGKNGTSGAERTLILPGRRGVFLRAGVADVRRHVTGVTSGDRFPSLSTAERPGRLMDAPSFRFRTFVEESSLSERKTCTLRRSRLVRDPGDQRCLAPCVGMPQGRTNFGLGRTTGLNLLSKWIV